MKTYSQTFSGVATWQLNVPGRYFTIVGCTNAVTVRFYHGGKQLDLGEVNNLLAGLEVTFPGEGFDRIELDTTAADVVQVGIGNGQARYNRSQGNVAVTGQVPAQAAPANTQKTVTNASAQLLAANPARKMLIIQNKDSAGSIWLNFGAGAATQANGFKLGPGQTWDTDVIPTTAIQAIGDASSNANIVVIEG